jgi:hypothetical protein
VKREARRLLGLTVVALLAVVVMAGPATAGKNGPNSANAKLCQKDGWQTLRSSTGAPFLNEKECTSYAAQGGEFGLGLALAVYRDMYPCPEGGGTCWGRISGAGLLAGANVIGSFLYSQTGEAGPIGTVAQDGTFALALNQPCGSGLVSFGAASTLADGAQTSSNTVSPPC